MIESTQDVNDWDSKKINTLIKMKNRAGMRVAMILRK